MNMPKRIWACDQPNFNWRGHPWATLNKPPINATAYVRSDIVAELMDASRGALFVLNEICRALPALKDQPEISALRAAINKAEPM